MPTTSPRNPSTTSRTTRTIPRHPLRTSARNNCTSSFPPPPDTTLQSYRKPPPTLPLLIAGKPTVVHGLS